MAFKCPGNALFQVPTCAAYNTRLVGVLGAEGEYWYMHLQPKVHLSKDEWHFELVFDPCWSAWTVVETKMEEAGGTVVVGMELRDTVKWPCFEACDTMVL